MKQLNLTSIVGKTTMEKAIFEHRIKDIYTELKKDPTLTLGHDVVSRLKCAFIITEEGVKPLSFIELKQRRKLLKFNNHRVRMNNFIEYLERKAAEEVEQDYISCDIVFELRFGL